jgi:hypothetical protein
MKREFKMNGMRGEVNGYGIYLRINKYYVATVRRLEDLVSYLNEVGDTDETFGTIESVNGASDFDIRMVNKIVKQFKRLQAKQFLGKHVYVHRNQAMRSGYVVASNENGFLIEYQMPNGTTALNVINDINRPDVYKSITYDKAIHSRAFGEDLIGVELIKNPQ